MKIKNSLLLLGSLALSSHLVASINSPKVIYGEDNRKDVFESNNPSFIELSKSTAAMISTDKLKSAGLGVMITGSTLQARGICAKERFSKQLATANCSGFLVAPNKIVTAGHCIKTEADCRANKWVFDYKVERSDQTNISVSASSVYSCKRIIARKLDTLSKDDYAVIELDRRVADRHPLKLRQSGKAVRGDALVVIGHPSGLPTKIADGANVRSLQTKYFVANLDTYGGNSGSAVFNVKTEEVEGILVRGETDYVYSSTDGCQVSNRCANDACRGEEVTYITNVPGLNAL